MWTSTWGAAYEVKGIAFNGYTARKVLFHNGADCAHFGVNVVIENSLCVAGPGRQRRRTARRRWVLQRY